MMNLNSARDVRLKVPDTLIQMAIGAANIRKHGNTPKLWKKADVSEPNTLLTHHPAMNLEMRFRSSA